MAETRKKGVEGMDLSKLDALYQRTSRGPWRHDAMENIGKNWLIGIMCAGEDRDNKAVHILTTDDVSASSASSDPETDCQWIAAVHNAWPEIIAAQPSTAASWELVEKALGDIKAEVDLNLPCVEFDIDEDDMDVHVDDCIGCTIMDSVRAALLEIERARQAAGAGGEHVDG